MTSAELKNQIPEYRDGNIYMTDNDVEHCIMYGDEAEYIKESIRQILSRTDAKTVIEIGYGLGFTADEFQNQGVERHIIIEPNKFIYDKAVEWAEGKRGVEVINKRHQDIKADELPRVDLVYDDIYELVVPYKKERYNFHFRSKWYAQFCVNHSEGDVFGDEYFRFQIGEYDKLQLLERNNGN